MLKSEFSPTVPTLFSKKILKVDKKINFNNSQFSFMEKIKISGVL